METKAGSVQNDQDRTSSAPAAVAREPPLATVDELRESMQRSKSDANLLPPPPLPREPRRSPPVRQHCLPAAPTKAVTLRQKCSKLDEFLVKWLLENCNHVSHSSCEIMFSVYAIDLPRWRHMLNW